MFSLCDTICAVKNATVDGSVILAKNSDREPNEGHSLLYFPRQTHDPETEMVIATHGVEIPQVEETYAIIMSSPWWIYGCEMGTNEFGVTIGNEAVFTKEPESEKGLIGMDFIRLALERTKTALQALDLIITLLEKYGQGGYTMYQHKNTYHNSFLIADPKEAWVLETADKYWIAEKVKDIRTISNTLTIGREYDRIHPKLIEHGLEKGYIKSREDFHFAKSFTAGILDDYRNWGAKGMARHQRTTQLLKKNQGNINPAYMMKVLRDHNLSSPDPEKKWHPSKGSFGCICIHAKPIFVVSQSTAAMVSHLHSEIQTHWLTGTSATCTSIFKPVFVEAGLPEIGPPPTNKYDSQSLWWQHERIHRAILEDFSGMELIQPDIRVFEEKWLTKANELVEKLKSESLDVRKVQLKEFSDLAFKEALNIEEKWIESLLIPSKKKNQGGCFYRKYCRNESKKAAFPKLNPHSPKTFNK